MPHDHRRRVLHSYPVWLPQTQTWMYNQLRFLPAVAIDGHVVCEMTENLDQFGTANVHCLADAGLHRQLWHRGLRKLGIRNYVAYYGSVMDDIDADILHSHFGPTGWLDLAAIGDRDVAHVVTFYGTDASQVPHEDPLWRERYRELFAGVDRVLCEGPHMAGNVAALGCPEDKITVHHLGVPISEIPFQPRRWEAGEPLRVLMASRFTEKKGIPYAIEALAAVAPEVDIQLTLVGDSGGKPEDDHEKATILRTIQDTGMQNRVALPGFLSHAKVHKLAAQHHIFMSPSVTASTMDTEGGAPVILIEAIASGMPIIATDHCDVPEVVGDAYRDRLAPERDVKALVDQLDALTTDPSSWERLTASARDHVEREFDAEVQGQRLAAIYQAMLAD